MKLKEPLSYFENFRAKGYNFGQITSKAGLNVAYLTFKIRGKLKVKTQFGGSLLYKKRKSKRPLDFKKTTHLVLRLKERLPSFFNPRDKRLEKIYLQAAEKNKIKIYNLIFNHSHCHAVKIESRQEYVRFIRELTSKLVQYFSANKDAAKIYF